MKSMIFSYLFSLPMDRKGFDTKRWEAERFPTAPRTYSFAAANFTARVLRLNLLDCSDAEQILFLDVRSV
jgi:hypothetical protein